MKKILFCLLFSLMFISVLNAEELITIKSIELDSSSINGTELSKPIIDGYDINLDVELKEIGDYLKYKLVIDNKYDKDYYLKEDTGFLEGNYISYKYYTERVIKAKSENVIYLVVSYVNEVEDKLLVNKMYTDSNNARLEIVDDKGIVIKNPKTYDSKVTFILLCVVLLFSCICLFLVKRKNISKVSFILIMLLINCVPLLIDATELFKINLNVKALISKEGFHVFYSPDFSHSKLLDATILDDYDIVSEECNLIYLNNEKDKPDLVNCNSTTIFKSKKEYFKGNIVDLLVWEYYDYYGNNVSNFLNTCTKENNNLYCSFSKDEIVSEKYSFPHWSYHKYSNLSLGYTYFENDDLTMKFSNLDKQYGNWNSGYLNINLPSTFNMPEHGVFFSYAMPQ